MNLVCAVCSQPVARKPKVGWQHVNPATECTWGNPQKPGVHLRDDVS